MEDLIETALGQGARVLQAEGDRLEVSSEVVCRHVAELRSFGAASEWAQLHLDHPSSRGYVFKTLGAALCALRRCPPRGEAAEGFRRTIEELVMQAGDADTNAAVAGALLGAAHG